MTDKPDPMPLDELARLLAVQTWAKDWPHNTVPPGKFAQELCCHAVRALPSLIATARDAEALQGEVARLRACFTPDARAVMEQLGDGEVVYPIAQISADASADCGLTIGDRRTRKILQALRTLGLANFGPLVREEGEPCGSGYWISNIGYKARAALGEK